jgi:protein-disulfide isomerase
MRIFAKDSQKAVGSSSTITVLLAALPLSLLLGLWLGYQIWGTPNVQLDQQTAEIESYDIPIDEYDAVRGPADAKVTIVEFTDYECGYCQRYYTTTFPQIIEQYGDQIQYVVKDLPLVSIHPNAIPASIAAHCAGEQNAFWEYHDLLFNMQFGLNDDAYQAYAQNLGLDLGSFNTCLDSGNYDRAVMADTNILTNINAPLSTPTFFINGQYLAGAQPFEVFAQLIEAELAAAD